MKSVLCAAVLLAVSAASPTAARAVSDDDGSNSSEMVAFRNGAFAEALTGWMRAARAGDGRAARYVGVLYDTGEGVAQDQAEALRWYRRGAELGDVPSMFNVAVCFDAGRGAARDPVEAARWYRRAATHRFGRAEYNLALMREDGDGVPRDRHAAALLFEAALQDGIGAARLHLPPPGLSGARAAAVRRGPPARAGQGAETADTVFAAAQKALLGRSPDASTRAASLFAQAARESGPAASMARYDLAWCYQNGIGVPVDQQRAYRIFVRVAAETDDPVLGRLARAAAARAAVLQVTVSNSTRPAEAER